MERRDGSFNPDEITHFIIRNNYASLADVKIDVSGKDPHIQPFAKGDEISLEIIGSTPDTKQVIWEDGRVIREVSLNDDDVSDDFQMPNSDNYDFNAIKYRAGSYGPQDLHEIINFDNNTYLGSVLDRDGIDGGSAARIKTNVENNALVASLETKR
ncbi:hypothetical protein AB835_06260 [Candidatus Endobugula sertula]|uniref:Uncharacterized protein n=1 Tax=Candidatus Endobugula sertula TaxID=62101 RepID=A0A1D2QQR8_9GAMM|nr:hypothetical protein AB835_06260 [Candidatus Endobugula sertula]